VQLDGREDPTNENFRVLFSASLSVPLRDLLIQMLSFDPSQRPRVADIRAHEWFAGMQQSRSLAHPSDLSGRRTRSRTRRHQLEAGARKESRPTLAAAHPAGRRCSG
jgi:hypothetical protein